MQIKTPEGVAEAMPLSDIQEYNKQLKRNNNILKGILLLSIAFFVLIVIILVYLDVTNFTYWIIRTYKTIGCME